MRLRGLNNPDELLAFASASVILQTCEWWDCKRGAGPGLLAKAIRDGGVTAPAPTPRSPTAGQSDYWTPIIAWLTEHMPELCDPRDGPHPGAMIAVWKLRDRDGKDNLSAARHGRLIRAGVARFDRIGTLSAADQAKAEARGRERLGITTPPPTPVNAAVEAIPERAAR